MLATAVLLASLQQVAPAIVAGEVGGKLDSWLTRAARFGVHGAILVEHDGEVVLHKGYGLAEHAASRPITRRTRFEIGSLGKQFTAAAVVSLIEAGELDYDSTLGGLLDDVPDDKRAISVHALLCHRSGLAYHPRSADLLAEPLQFAPGERYAYSNVGYSLLARVIEAVTGRQFDEVVAGMFERAGVGNIELTGQPTRWDDVAHGYIGAFDAGTHASMGLGNLGRGPGGYACTVGELHRWIRALEAGRVVSIESLKRMWTDHGRVEDPRIGYGYGWELLATLHGSRLVRHRGNFNGFDSELRRYPDDRRTIAFLSNHFVGGRSMRDAVVNRVALMLVGAEVPEPPAVIEVDAAVSASRAGEYRSERGSVRVAAAGSALLLTGIDQSGVAAVFGRVGDEAATALATDCATRSETLLRAVHAGEQAEAEALIDPAWVRPQSYHELRRRLAHVAGEALDVLEVLGTAVSDPARRDARTTVRVGAGDRVRTLELVWTNRGAIGCQNARSTPPRRFEPTAPAEYSAFDPFTGREVVCKFDGDALLVGTPPNLLGAKRG